MSTPVAAESAAPAATVAPVTTPEEAGVEVAAGFRLVVREIVAETHDTRSVVFEVPAEHAEQFRYAPGQFLTVRVPGTDRAAPARCYSLSSAPDLDEHLTVTVKRVSGGVVSNWLCDNLEPGYEVDVLPPAGRFTPRSLDLDLLLFAGGSGITPIISIARSVLDRGNGSVVLVYANRDDRSVIFDDRLRELAARHPDRFTVLHLLESVEGLPTTSRLRALAAPYTWRDRAFVCGPAPFMDAVTTALDSAGMPRDRVVVERFLSLVGDPFTGPPAPIPTGDAGTDDADAARLAVTIDDERHEMAWPRSTPLLDLLLSKGIAAPFSCREGACSACACRVSAGEVTMTRNDVLEKEDLDEGLVLGCQSLPVTDEVEVTYD